MEHVYTEAETHSIAEKILTLIGPHSHATILALQGDLGAGKTTITQAIAKQLGVEDTVVSPTFVIAKFYTPTAHLFKHLVHIDAYRIEDVAELGPLQWDILIQQPDTLIIVEWPEKIINALPLTTHQFLITHQGQRRRIKQLT